MADQALRGVNIKCRRPVSTAAITSVSSLRAAITYDHGEEQDSANSTAFYGHDPGQASVMLIDILVAVLIVAVAAVLGLIVHPVLWVIVIAAVLWLFTRRGRVRSRL
jgi:hypothetical protein